MYRFTIICCKPNDLNNLPLLSSRFTELCIQLKARGLVCFELSWFHHSFHFKLAGPGHRATCRVFYLLTTTPKAPAADRTASPQLERHHLETLLEQVPAAIGVLTGPEHRWTYINQ